MELSDIQDILGRISGATFASLDTETHPATAFTKTTTGENVILFSSPLRKSGYESMVKRRLIEIGLPDAAEAFHVGDLPWGTRIENGPLIVHGEKFYLQTVLIYPGFSRYYVGRSVPQEITKQQWETQFPRDKELKLVNVHTYSLASIIKIRLLGEERPVP